MSTTTFQQSEVLNDQGFRPVSLLLNEPFEIIVANNPLWKIERTANGETVFMSPTGGKSGVRNSEITFQLENWARSNGGTAFDSSTLFRLPNGALRSPDGCWLQTIRWQSLTDQEQESFPPIAPDFVIELRSRTDRLIDLQEKMNEYAGNGVRLGWLIDPFLKQVHIYRRGEAPVILNNPTVVSGETVLAGFTLDMSRIFI